MWQWHSPAVTIIFMETCQPSTGFPSVKEPHCCYDDDNVSRLAHGHHMSAISLIHLQVLKSGLKMYQLGSLGFRVCCSEN